MELQTNGHPYILTIQQKIKADIIASHKKTIRVLKIIDQKNNIYEIRFKDNPLESFNLVLR